MKKTIGIIQTILGAVVTITSFIGIFLTKNLGNIPIPETVVIDQSFITSIIKIIQTSAQAYGLLILLIGIFMLTEGLSKIKNENTIQN